MRILHFYPLKWLADFLACLRNFVGLLEWLVLYFLLSPAERSLVISTVFPEGDE